jgi:DeoR/GlpR family transcriptional regulator of sugar metabolism
MKRERAIVEGRREQLVQLVRENPLIKVDQLAHRLDVSAITIRRDLQALEEAKRLVRFYGGARLLQPEDDQEWGRMVRAGAGASDFSKDEVYCYREQIARFAAQFVEAHDTVFVNNSRNALQMVGFISVEDVTVITNNSNAMNKMRTNGVKVVMTGGELGGPKYAMVGDFAIRNLEKVYAKKAFLGCYGISPEAGVTTEILSEVGVDELMAQHSTDEVYILADHTKVGQRGSYVECALGSVTSLITDEKAPEDVLDRLRDAGVRVYQVKR